MTEGGGEKQFLHMYYKAQSSLLLHKEVIVNVAAASDGGNDAIAHDLFPRVARQIEGPEASTRSREPTREVSGRTIQTKQDKKNRTLHLSHSLRRS